MFTGNWKEAHELLDSRRRKSGLSQVFLGDLNENQETSLLLLLKLMHGVQRKIPNNLDIVEFVELLQLFDRFMIVGPFTRSRVIAHLEQLYSWWSDKGYPEKMIMLAYCARVLQAEEIFREAIRILCFRWPGHADQEQLEAYLHLLSDDVIGNSASQI